MSMALHYTKGSGEKKADRGRRAREALREDGRKKRKKRRREERDEGLFSRFLSAVSRASPHKLGLLRCLTPPSL